MFIFYNHIIFLFQTFLHTQQIFCKFNLSLSLFYHEFNLHLLLLLKIVLKVMFHESINNTLTKIYSVMEM
jgi:hypothetical protein